MIVIVSISVALVVGRHFDATWAGGEGYMPQTSIVTVLDEKTLNTTCAAVDPTRENIVTCSGERKKITFGASTIWLDENTSLVVADRREGFEALTFYGGRIVVTSPTTLHVRDLEYRTGGMASLVNYGWLSKLDVFAIDGDVTETSTTVPSGSAVRFDTLAPYDVAEEISTDFAHSNVAAFYTWVDRH